MDYGLIKKLAKEKGITVKKLAELSDITEPGLYKTMKNETMQIVVLERISTNLDVSPAVFFGSTKQKDSEELLELLRENRILRIQMEKLRAEYKTMPEIDYSINEPSSSAPPSKDK